jgi:hypothetical protein
VGTLRKWFRKVVVNLRQVAKSKPVSVTVARILRGMVCRLDCHLRRAFRIREFSLDRNCILRLAKVRWKRPVELQDVIQIAGGDSIGDLHLWNEHAPRILGSRTSLSTGARFRTTMMSLMTRLAVYAAIEPGMREVVAWRFTPEYLGLATLPEGTGNPWRSVLVAPFLCRSLLSQGGCTTILHFCSCAVLRGSSILKGAWYVVPMPYDSISGFPDRNYFAASPRSPWRVLKSVSKRPAAHSSRTGQHNESRF